MKSILVVDDHPIFRSGLLAALAETGYYTRLKEASTGREALNLLEAENFDLLLLDLNLPDVSGMTILEDLKARERRPRTFVLSMHGEHDFAERALSLGARGYATKNLPFATIELALRLVDAGELFIEKDILSDFLSPKHRAPKADPAARESVETLSPREKEVLTLLMKGATMKEAAQRLCVSLRTAENYQSSLYTKLGARSAVELVMIALRSGCMAVDASAPSLS